MDIQDLRETAELAHLNLGEDELHRSFGAFEEMLGFFAAMQAADNDPAFSAAAPAQAVGASCFRGDCPIQTGSADTGETLLAQAGERDGRFVVIPNVL